MHKICYVTKQKRVVELVGSTNVLLNVSRVSAVSQVQS